MPRYIMKQPNNLFCVWSSVSDSPIVWNATKEDLYEKDYLTILDQPKRGKWLKEIVDKAISYNYIFENKKPLVNGGNFSVDKFKEFLADIETKLTIDDFTIYGLAAEEAE